MRAGRWIASLAGLGLGLALTVGEGSAQTRPEDARPLVEIAFAISDDPLAAEAIKLGVDVEDAIIDAAMNDRSGRPISHVIHDLAVLAVLQTSRDYLSRAPDAEIEALLEANLRFYDTLMIESPARCGEIAMAFTLDEYLATRIGTEYLDILYRPMLRLLRAHFAGEETGPVMPPDEARALGAAVQAHIGENLTTEEQEALSRFQRQRFLTTSDKLILCRMSALTFEYLTSLPPGRAAAYFRAQQAASG